MIASDVYTNLVLTLQNSPVLDYIKYVFKGIRDPNTIEPESMPCIMIEPESDGDIEKEMNNVQDIYLNLNIYAISSNNFNELDKTIVGDNDYKGILDINNDIRACLISSYSLGDTVIDTRIQTTQFSPPDFTYKYPIRGLVIPVKILYRQVDGI